MIKRYIEYIYFQSSPMLMIDTAKKGPARAPKGIKLKAKLISLCLFFMVEERTMLDAWTNIVPRKNPTTK